MPNVPQQTTGHTWAVTKQEEEPIIGDNGRPTTLHHVHFLTNTGHESHITLPDSHFSPANVAKAIALKAAHIVNVHTLNSSNAPKTE